MESSITRARANRKAQRMFLAPEEVGDEEGAGVDVGVVVVYYESAGLFVLSSVFLEGVDYCVLPFAQAPAYVCLEWAT